MEASSAPLTACLSMAHDLRVPKNDMQVLECICVQIQADSHLIMLMNSNKTHKENGYKGKKTRRFALKNVCLR